MSNNFRIFLLPAVALSLPAVCVAQEREPQLDPGKQTPVQIIAQAQSVHPATLYILASRLMGEGRMDDAVRWFYIGQLRYRFHLATNPPSIADERTLFSALSESVGRPVNEYAFGDIGAAVAQIDAALEWDGAHPNKFTSKERYSRELAEVRTGLQKLRNDMVANKEQIREARKRNGLENR